MADTCQLVFQHIDSLILLSFICFHLLLPSTCSKKVILGSWLFPQLLHGGLSHQLGNRVVIPAHLPQLLID